MTTRFIMTYIAADGRCWWIGFWFEPVVRWWSFPAVADDFWATAYRNPSSGPDGAELGPAFYFVDEVLRAGHPSSVDLIQALVDAAQSEDELGYVGAGPLEDLISRDTAGAFVERIERAAADDARFATALRNVWMNSGVQPAIRGRLARLGARDFVAEAVGSTSGRIARLCLRRWVSPASGRFRGHGSGGGRLARLRGPVHGGPGHAEQIAELGGPYWPLRSSSIRWASGRGFASVACPADVLSLWRPACPPGCGPG